jgi:uncharacterized repeat protein (TIGR01451 family)
MLARIFAALMLVGLMVPVSAQAAGNVALKSTVFVEKTDVDKDGRKRVMLQEPSLVTPGDKLVFILSYRNDSATPAANLIVTNPVPSAVAYQGAADDAAQVSVDGGRNWGALPALSIRDADGQTRNARPEDVTHVRWALKQGVPAGAQGKLSFRGIVR